MGKEIGGLKEDVPVHRQICHYLMAVMILLILLMFDKQQEKQLDGETEDFSVPYNTRRPCHGLQCKRRRRGFQTQVHRTQSRALLQSHLFSPRVDKVHHGPRISSFIFQSTKSRFNISYYAADHWQSRNEAPSSFLLCTLCHA